MKRWQIHEDMTGPRTVGEAVSMLLANRGLTEEEEKHAFLHPAHPGMLTPDEVGIDTAQFRDAVKRIRKAVKDGESIVVYGDYDADGITATAILWEALHASGARVMPYIPHRIEEGYGLSQKGIDLVIAMHDPSLIITVDHGITAVETVKYAESKGIDVIVTDHHTVPPAGSPDTCTVHTTALAGAGVSYMVAKEFVGPEDTVLHNDLMVLAAIGSIADMVPLMGANRRIASHGLALIANTRKPGLKALIDQAGLDAKSIGTREISHVIGPRLNAAGRLVHAMDALRLLCTRDSQRAKTLASSLGETNRQRQDMTTETTVHAETLVEGDGTKLLVVADASYNQGIIGLVAGRLVEQFYRPAIVISVGEEYAKASARSVKGFDIVSFIRSAGDLLDAVGGHPMAAGFSVRTEKLEELMAFFRRRADEVITDELLVRTLGIDAAIPLSMANRELYEAIKPFAPFGLGNPEPVFASLGVGVEDAKVIGRDRQHLKLSLKTPQVRGKPVEAIAFRMADMYEPVMKSGIIDIAYTVDLNVWNGTESVQLKTRDIRIPDAPAGA